MHVRLASLRVNCCYYAAPGPPCWSVPSGPPSGPFGPSGSVAGAGVVDSSSAAWSTDPVWLLFEMMLWVNIRPPGSINAATRNARVIFFIVRQLLVLPEGRHAPGTPSPIETFALSC